MKWVFWISLLLVAYAYAGYPFWLFLRSRWGTRPVRAAPHFPFVSIVVAAHDEAAVLPRKLQNLAELNYPADRYELVVVSDGSTDATNQILAAQSEERLRVYVSSEHEGKASALNRGIQMSRGDVLAFTDARQILDPDSLRYLAENFADPSVGCVSGELILGAPDAAPPLDGVGLYWTMEKNIRRWEGAQGCVIGATGALYAVRRELCVPLPAGTILDDVYIPLHVARNGARVVFEPRARAWDRAGVGQKQEFRRKVRTLTGNYQLVQLAPWLLTRANPVRFQFISHKLLRLLVPFALAGLLVSSLVLENALYRLAAVIQLLFYGSAALAAFRPKLGFVGRIANVALTFLMLNTAAVVALVNFASGKKQVWVR